MIVTPSMGLKRWDQPNDIFSYTELSDNFAAIDSHDHTSGKGAQIPTAGLANLAVDSTKLADNSVTTNKINTGAVDSTRLANSAVTGDKLSTVAANQIGATQSGAVRAGKSIIATNEARTNTSYGLLATPDRVSGITLGTDGLIMVAYQAQWMQSIVQQARAAIFLNSNQLTIASLTSTSPLIQAAGMDQGISLYGYLSTYAGGLVGGDCNLGMSDPVTTGQVVGMVNRPGFPEEASIEMVGGPLQQVALGVPSGICYIFAAAGTYDISVQFKALSGTVTVKNRKLWVWTRGF